VTLAPRINDQGLDGQGIADQAARLRDLVLGVDSESSAKAEAARTPSPPQHTGLGTVVAVCSGKGGVGKTTFAVNAAAVLARKGVRTIVVDLDVGVANADVLLGLTPRARLSRRALVEGRLAERLLATPYGLRLVAGIIGASDASRLRPDEIDGAILGIERLRSHADLIFVDTGAGVGVESITLAATADASLIVTTPEPASIADAYASHKCIAYAGVERGGQPKPSSWLIVNAADNAKQANAAAARLNATSERFLGGGLPCLGWIRRDRRVGRSAHARVPVAVNTPLCRVSRDIAGCAHAVWSACAARRADVRTAGG